MIGGTLGQGFILRFLPEFGEPCALGVGGGSRTELIELRDLEVVTDGLLRFLPLLIEMFEHDSDGRRGCCFAGNGGSGK